MLALQVDLYPMIIRTTSPLAPEVVPAPALKRDHPSTQPVYLASPRRLLLPRSDRPRSVAVPAWACVPGAGRARHHIWPPLLAGPRFS